jgi:hypothetical protein
MRNISLIKLSLLVSVLVLISGSGSAQEPPRFSDWSAPLNIGPFVNTPGFDGCPFVTKDGLDLIFMSNYGSTSQNLYVSHRETPASPWGNPISLGADINTAAYGEFCPALSISGRYLYFVSDRPGGCGNSDIYVSRRLDKNGFPEWSEPQNLGCQVNSAGIELSPSLFENEDGTVYLYFSSGLRPGGLGFGDIYVSQLQADGTFGPASPVFEFNTPFNEIRPKIRARDGLEIFFDRNGPGSMMGSPDLYASTRNCASCPWTPAVNLGPVVNSNSIEGGAALSFDGTELYFMSNRPGGVGDQDIYVVRRSKLTGAPAH